MGIVEGSSFAPKLKPYKPVSTRKPDRHWTTDAMGVINVARALGPGFDAAARAITRGVGEDELIEAIAAEEELRTIQDVTDKEMVKAGSQDPLERFKAAQRDAFGDAVAEVDANFLTRGDRIAKEAGAEGEGAAADASLVQSMVEDAPVKMSSSMEAMPLSQIEERTVTPLQGIARPANTKAAAHYDVALERANKQRAKQASAIPDLLGLYRMSLEELRNLAQWGLSSDPSERLIEMKRLNKAASAVGKAELGASGFWSALSGATGEAAGKQYVLKDAKTRNEFDQMNAAKDAMSLESGALGMEVAQKKLDKKKGSKSSGGTGKGYNVGMQLLYDKNYNSRRKNTKIDEITGLSSATKRMAKDAGWKTLGDYLSYMSKKPVRRRLLRDINSSAGRLRTAQPTAPAAKDPPKVKPPLTLDQESNLNNDIAYLVGDFGDSGKSPSKIPGLTAALNKTDWTSGNVKSAQAKLRTLIGKLNVRINTLDQKTKAGKIKELQGDVKTAKRVQHLLGVLSVAKQRRATGGTGAKAPTGASQGKPNSEQVNRDPNTGKLQ